MLTTFSPTLEGWCYGQPYRQVKSLYIHQQARQLEPAVRLEFGGSTKGCISKRELRLWLKASGFNEPQQTNGSHFKVTHPTLDLRKLGNDYPFLTIDLTDHGQASQTQVNQIRALAKKMGCTLKPDLFHAAIKNEQSLESLCDARLYAQYRKSQTP